MSERQVTVTLPLLLAEHLLDGCEHPTNAPAINGYSCDWCKETAGLLRTALEEGEGETAGERELADRLLADDAVRAGTHAALRFVHQFPDDGSENFDPLTRAVIAGALASIGVGVDSDGDRSEPGFCVRSPGLVGVDPNAHPHNQETAQTTSGDGEQIDSGWRRLVAVEYGSRAKVTRMHLMDTLGIKPPEEWNHWEEWDDREMLRRVREQGKVAALAAALDLEPEPTTSKAEGTEG